MSKRQVTELASCVKQAREIVDEALPVPDRHSTPAEIYQMQDILKLRAEAFRVILDELATYEYES